MGDKIMNDDNGESGSVFYKVARLRTNGKVYVYPEVYTDLDSAREQMIRSATGKYYGRCFAYVFRVDDAGAKKIKAFGVDSSIALDATAYTGDNAEVMNRRKYTTLVTKYFLMLSVKSDDAKQKAQDFIKDVILPFLSNSGLDKSKLAE